MFAAASDYLITAPIAFGFGVLMGLLLSSRYRIVRRTEFTDPHLRGGPMQETPPTPTPEPEPEPEPRPDRPDPGRPDDDAPDNDNDDDKEKG